MRWLDIVESKPNGFLSLADIVRRQLWVPEGVRGRRG